MVKKRNKRGLSLPNVWSHREKLKLNYRARGRPCLPKYLLEGLTVTPVHEELSSEKIGPNSPFAMKAISSARNLGSELLKGARCIVDLPYLFENYEKLGINHINPNEMNDTSNSPDASKIGLVSGLINVSTMPEMDQVADLIAPRPSISRTLMSPDRLLLLRLLHEHVDILSNKEPSLVHIKRRVWQQILNSYHEQTGVEQRTMRQIQKYWENYKTRRKKNIEQGMTLAELLSEDIKEMEEYFVNAEPKVEIPEKYKDLMKAIDPVDHVKEESGANQDLDGSVEYDVLGHVNGGESAASFIDTSDDQTRSSFKAKGPPGLYKLSEIDIIPICHLKRQSGDVNQNLVKKPKIETAEAYYDLKIQHEMERFQIEKQLFAQKLEYMKKRHEKEMESHNYEMAWKQEAHDMEMRVLKQKLQKNS